MSALARFLLLAVGVALLLRPDVLRAEDLAAGKSGKTLFVNNCAGCHHTARGLAARMNWWSLGSFLRQHYTASPGSASALAAYLRTVDSNAPPSKQKNAATGALRTAPAGTKRATEVGSDRLAPRPPQSVPGR